MQYVHPCSTDVRRMANSLYREPMAPARSAAPTNAMVGRTNSGTVASAATIGPGSPSEYNDWTVIGARSASSSSTRDIGPIMDDAAIRARRDQPEFRRCFDIPFAGGELWHHPEGAPPGRSTRRRTADVGDVAGGDWRDHLPATP